MRRLVALAALMLTLTAAGCGDDGGAPTASPTAPTTASTLPPIGENPDPQECRVALRAWAEALHVPDGVEASDGLDDVELAATQEMTLNADRQSGYGDRSTCVGVLPSDEYLALFQSIDPEIKELLAASLTPPHTSG